MPDVLLLVWSIYGNILVNSWYLIQKAVRKVVTDMGAVSQLFDNLAEDHFKLFDGTVPKYGEVVNTLDFKTRDVAKATGVSQASVRFDRHIPKDVQTRITEWANLLNLVADHFDGNLDKTILWFKLSNPLLGNFAPRDMIRIGRYNKLYKFIMNSLSENAR